jgi:hypothetical protein
MKSGILGSYKEPLGLRNFCNSASETPPRASATKPHLTLTVYERNAIQRPPLTVDPAFNETDYVTRAADKKDTLREEEQWPPSAMSPSTPESPATVSRVVNGLVGYSDETRERVETAVKSLSYYLARGSRPGRPR